MDNPVFDPAYFLPPLTAILVCFVLTVIVISRGHRRLDRWIFAAVIVSVGIWGIMLFGMRSSPNVEYAITWSRLASIPAAATFVLFYHFTVVYTEAKKQKWFPLIAYLILLGVIAISPTALIIKNVSPEPYGYSPNQGDLSLLVSGILFLPWILSIYNLIRAYFSTRSPEERNRYLYLLIALWFPTVGALLDSITGLPPMLVWAQVIFVLICSIAIIKFHLLDVRIVFRRSLSYIAVSTLVGIPYGIVLYSLNHVIEDNIETIWYGVLLILFLAVFLHPMQQWVQKVVDKLFFRERYDYLLALDRLNNETQSILDIDELCRKIMGTLAGALRVTSGCLFLRSNDDQWLALSYCTNHLDGFEKLQFGTSSQFTQWMATHGQVVTTSDYEIVSQLQNLTDQEKYIVDKLNVKLFVPIILQGKKMTGLLALGPKAGKRDYSTEDIQLIHTVASQMALSLENARLYNTELNLRHSLEELNRQKTEFLHTVAHELKTPLTAIMSSSEILDEQQPESENVRQRLYANIKQGAHIMNDRVTELLELAKTQIGELKLDVEPVEVQPFIRDSVSQLMILFDNKNQRLIMNVDENIPVVYADKDKLQQVLFNFLSNANKYSPVGGYISLTAGTRNQDLLVQVGDSGPRIPEDDREKIFDAYYRVEEIESITGSSGLGLGLAISKKFIELHHGNIWVDQNPDRGNIFSFTIPLD